MLTDFATYIAKEWAAVGQAKLTFLMALLFCATAIWAAVRWWSAGVVENLREQVETLNGRIAQRDELIAKLKAQQAEAPQAPDRSFWDTGSEPDRAAGAPSMKLIPAFEYVSKDSHWSRAHRATGPDVLREIVDKLHLKKLSAWGRREPDSPLNYIPASEWVTLRLNPGTRGAEINGVTQYHDIQFDQGYVEMLWPLARV